MAAASSRPKSRTALQRNSPRRGDGPRPPLLDLPAIQKGVQVSVQQLERKRRGLPRVAGDEGDLPALDAAQDLRQAVDVEWFVQAVFHRLPRQRMIGQLELARRVLLAARQPRKDGRKQVLRPEPLQRRGDFLAPFSPQDKQGPRDVPAPADLEHGDPQARPARTARARSAT